MTLFYFLANTIDFIFHYYKYANVHVFPDWNYIIYWIITVQNCHIRGGKSTMEKMFTKENS
jgi:hypothetical protein